MTIALIVVLSVLAGAALGVVAFLLWLSWYIER
jgi:hypothetical protein